MANLLTIPFKKSYFIDVKEPTRRYLETQTDAHPEAFRSDLNQWQQLRKDTVDLDVHVNAVEKLVEYHAQLVAILTKLPADIGLEISYASVFPPNNLPVTLSNLVFERASILFNLAALYSQLAAKEDRLHLEGIKRAIGYYQNAAGTLSYLRNSALPTLTFSPQDEEKPLDLSKEFIHGLEWLMLAQAQECFWQKAKIDNFKNGLIAKLAANTSSYYKLSISAIREAPSPINQLLPNDWAYHIEAKQHHFQAVACFRKSMEEIDSSNYGLEIAYLKQAQVEVKRAYDSSRRGRVTQAVQKDVQSLTDVVQSSLTRAERDNDLIYHKDVPAASALPPIPHAAIAKITIPVGLANPAQGSHMIMGELLGWGAQEAINIYNDRKKNLLEDQLVAKSTELKDRADGLLRRHNLPASLEALERPIGLPPSLLKKAEEVRREEGPTKIESWFEDLQRQARHVTHILDEAIDILDNEAADDETARESGALSRPPSHEANVELIQKEQRYRSILQQAAASDETVRRKWDEWEENIMDLIISEAELEALVPSSTSSKRRTPEAAVTQRYARNLRVLLESLDTLHTDRAQIVRRASALADADDIHPLILKEAARLRSEGSGMGMGSGSVLDVRPAAFENVLDEALAKYDKFCGLMGESEGKMEDVLTSIEADNEKFLASRKDDPSIKEREHALQSLDLSYHKYREISGNLQEGIKFYNDLAGLLLQFKDACKIWSNHRQEEIHSLTQAMSKTSLHSHPPSRDLDPHTRTPSHTHSPSPSHFQSQANDLDSDEEDVEEDVVPEEEEEESDYEVLDIPSTPSEKAKGKMPERAPMPMPMPPSLSDWGFESIALPPGPQAQAQASPKKKKRMLA